MIRAKYIPAGKVCWEIKLTNLDKQLIIADEIKFSKHKLVKRNGITWTEICPVHLLLGKPKILDKI